MYEITSCQIGSGNEDDKVVPYIDYNYSFCPVLSPPAIVLMGGEKGVRSYRKDLFFQQEKESLKIQRYF